MLAITGALAAAKRKISRTPVRWLSYCVVLLCCLGAPWARALGLGDLRVQSNLGQPLRASIPILGEQAEALLQVCVKARLVNLDGALISPLRVSLGHEAGLPALLLSSHLNIDEPALTVQLEVTCENQISRNYPVLLDPLESTSPARTATAPGSSSSSAASSPSSSSAASSATSSSSPSRVSSKSSSKSALSSSRQAANSDVGAGLTRRLSRESKRRARNVLKLEASDLSGALLLGPQTNSAPTGTSDDRRLPLQLSRRLRNDTSSVASAAQEAFSDTVRQQQNQAVFFELGRAELKLMQKQILAMEAELAQLKRTAPAAAVPTPEAATSAAAVPTPEAVTPAAAEPTSEAAVPTPTAAAAVLPVINAPAASSNRVDNRTQQWLLGLAVLLLLCLLAIAWLLWRLLQLRSSQARLSLTSVTVAPQSVIGHIEPSLELAENSLGNEPIPEATAPIAASAKTPAGKGKGKDKSARKALSSAHGTSPVSAFEAVEPVLAPDADEASFDFALAEQTQAEPGKSVKLEKNDPLDTADTADIADIADGTPLLPPLHFRNAIDYATSTEMPKVEELNDVMYEAEFWISLNKIDNAIRLLEQYTISDQGSSPLPWLLLFDLYHRTEQNEQYISLQRQFQRFFNGKIPDWDDYDNAQQSIGLEAMGTLMARVEVLWHTDEIIPFLESLLLDDRDGTREGFELGVYRDILFLCDLAKDVRRSNGTQAQRASELDLVPLE